MSRLTPTDRRAAILAAALTLAAERGLPAITRDGVAAAAGCSPALVSAYFYTVPELRNRVVEQAVACEQLRVLADGLVARHPAAIAAPAWLKAKALAVAAGV
jgi:AcrR family transcriptional regulator